MTPQALLQLLPEVSCDLSTPQLLGDVLFPFCVLARFSLVMHFHTIPLWRDVILRFLVHSQLLQLILWCSLWAVDECMGSSTPVVFAVLTCDVPVCWSAPSRHCKWVLMIWVAVVELPVSLFNFASFFVLVVASSAEGLCYYVHVCLWMHWPSSPLNTSLLF